MTIVDYIIIATLIIFMIYGLIRGFFKEVISLGSWVIGVWAALTFSSQIAPWLIPKIPFINQMEFFADSLLRQTILTGAIIFFGFAFLGAIINFIATRIVEKVGLGGMNRFFGMCFGAVKGALIISVVSLFIINSPLLKEEPVWVDSKLRPHVERSALWLESVLPDSVLAYLPGRDESYGMLSGLQTQALSLALKDQGLDLSTIDLTEMDIESIDFSTLDTEELEIEKAKEYLMQLKRHQSKK